MSVLSYRCTEDNGLSFELRGSEIMAAVPASPEELLRAGVDCSLIPSTYDPLSVECEGAG